MRGHDCWADIRSNNSRLLLSAVARNHREIYFVCMTTPGHEVETGCPHFDFPQYRRNSKGAPGLDHGSLPQPFEIVAAGRIARI